MKSKSNDMTVGNPISIIIRFTIPLLIGNIFQQLYSMIDTIIVGKYVGVEAFAAVGSTGSITFLINGFVLGLTSGFGVLIAQKFGAKKTKSVKRAVASAYTLAIIATIICTIISLLLTKPLLRIMNTPDNIFQFAYNYLIIIFGGIAATVAYNILATVLRALGDSKTPLYFLAFASVLNITLDLVFIINFKMGVSGAALATIVSQLCSALLCLIYTLKKYEILRLNRKDFIVDTSYYTRHLKIGIPMAIQFSITAVGIMVVQGELNKLGSNAIAGYTTASKVFQLANQPFATFGVTMASYCGQNLGAKEFTRIKDGVKKCIYLSVGTSIVLSLLMFTCGDMFIDLFIDNPSADIISFAKTAMNTYALFFIPLSLIYIYRNALQGMGQSFVPMMAGVYELVARAAVAFTLPRYFGYIAICMSDPAAWFAASIPLGIYYYKTIKKLTNNNREAVIV